MTFEAHPFLLNLSSTGKRIHLIPPAIGKDISVPVHKLMQSAGLLQYGSGRAQIEVIGISKDNSCIDIL